jgi:hypothetical protein
MKFFIQIDNSVFPLSKTMANSIKIFSNGIQIIRKGKDCIFLSNAALTTSFRIIPTKSSTHFYTMFLLKKYRINKKFFTFLDSISRKTVESNFKKPHANNLDKFYTNFGSGVVCIYFYF